MYKKNGRKILVVVLFLIMLFNSMGCESRNPDDYTVEEHIERIEQRLKERENGQKGDFCIYPLYDENEGIIMFLAEYEPEGFMLIKLFNPSFWGRFYELIIGKQSMYRGSSNSSTWAERFMYKNEETEVVRFITDENGDKITHEVSPYKLANVLDKRLYLLNIQGASYIPAIKTQNGFINVLSMEEFSTENPDWKKIPQEIFLITGWFTEGGLNL